MSNQKLAGTLGATIEAIKKKPEMAKSVFRSETELVEDVRCTAKIRDFDTMIIDEPPELGGADAGPNPVELLLAALGTCQEIIYSAYASVMGIQLDSVKVDVKGYLNLQGLFGMDENIPSGYEKIMFETKIESPADDEQLKQLIATVESHCPVLDSLVRSVEVKGAVTANGNKLT